MAELSDLPWQGRGMLLLQGSPDSVVSWAQRGLLPVHVVPLQGWTAVLPAGPSHARPPYDDTLKTLAGRPVLNERPADLIAASGTRDRTARRWIRELLVDGSGDAPHFLAGLLELLGLPGSDLLDGRRDPVATRGYTLVEPGAQHVAMFEKIISDEARHRADLEED